jgi:hypothetical protein
MSPQSPTVNSNVLLLPLPCDRDAGRDRSDQQQGEQRKDELAS